MAVAADVFLCVPAHVTLRSKGNSSGNSLR